MLWLDGTSYFLILSFDTSQWWVLGFDAESSRLLVGIHEQSVRVMGTSRLFSYYSGSVEKSRLMSGLLSLFAENRWLISFLWTFEWWSKSGERNWKHVALVQKLLNGVP